MPGMFTFGKSRHLIRLHAMPRQDKPPPHGCVCGTASVHEAFKSFTVRTPRYASLYRLEVRDTIRVFNIILIFLQQRYSEKNDITNVSVFPISHRGRIAQCIAATKRRQTKTSLRVILHSIRRPNFIFSFKYFLNHFPRHFQIFACRLSHGLASWKTNIKWKNLQRVYVFFPILCADSSLFSTMAHQFQHLFPSGLMYRYEFAIPPCSTATASVRLQLSRILWISESGSFRNIRRNIRSAASKHRTNKPL